MATATTALLVFLLATSYGVVSAQSPSSSEAADQYGYAKVTPSMAIIIVVLIAALFFMGFFSIYIRHCSDSSLGSVRPGGATIHLGRGSRRNAARGLDASVIETFPMLQYSEVKGLKIGKDTLECAVCLNEFEDDETLRLIPKCDHVFHPECIDVWLASHVTCPVCRANLTPQPGDGDNNANAAADSASTHEESHAESSGPELDLEAQTAPGPEEVESCHDAEPRELNRNRTHGSRSWRARRSWFPRSHSTGHSLVQPGENTDRFTLRLPEEVRKQIMNRQLERTTSLVVLPRERSSRRGYRGSGNEGSSRGKNYQRLEKLGELSTKSDRWVFARNPSFLARASSFLTRASSSIIRSGSVRSPKVAANSGEGTSTQPGGPDVNGGNRPPV